MGFRWRAPLAAAACAATALFASACGHGSRTASGPTPGPPRAFMMGISTLPRELNATSYADSFRLAGDTGDMVLIQRTPPWADFLPGADVSEDTAKTTAGEKDALHDGHLKLFYAIDPTDGSTGRDRLAGLPPSLSGRNFSDPDVRAAFISYAKYVALNYKPAYLALGVEMNLYYDKNKDDLENFKSLYDDAYDEVKQISSDTQVTVTFQYEDLQGILPTEDKHFADWQLLNQFEGKMDVAAISTYPSFSFPNAAAIPDNYYSQLRAFTDRPVVIAEAGYSSAAGAQGINNGTEADQASFAARLIAEAQNLKMPFVIWFAGWDPAYAQDTPFSVFQHIGLRRGDDSEKPAWNVWSDAARRPYAPAPTATPG
jgi:hypothetical protein